MNSQAENKINSAEGKMNFRGKRFGIQTLGCKVNEYESEKISQALSEAGLIRDRWDNEGLSICIINTCAVTNIADRKSSQAIRRARKINPGALIVAAGCQADEKKEENNSLGADLIILNSEKKKAAEIILEYLEGRDAENISENEYSGNDVIDRPCGNICNVPGKKTSDEKIYRKSCGRAFIKIQDGCRQFCSYCIIPYLRKEMVSREPEDILSEIRNLSPDSREIVLTGIHLSSYGLGCMSYEDAVKKNTNHQMKLLKLIEDISGIERIDRIRLGSLEPRILTEEFLYGLKNMPKFCPHFHLSLQTGSEKILKLMNRHYTKEEFRETVERIRNIFPCPAITADVITGFPGETEEDFEESFSFIREMDFYELHVFRYSERKGTRAIGMEGKVPERIRQERAERLLRMNEYQSEEYRKSFLGKEISIIAESVKEEDGFMTVGFTPEYVRAGVVFKTRQEAEGIVGNVYTGKALCYKNGTVILE